MSREKRYLFALMVLAVTAVSLVLMRPANAALRSEIGSLPPMAPAGSPDPESPPAAAGEPSTTVVAGTAVSDCALVTEIPTGECSALVALYNSTDGANWTIRTGWLGDSTPCDWYGIACDQGRVTGLTLSNNQLRGRIPPELGSLTDLRALYLDANLLSGSIPPELGSLADLQGLRLSYNQLSGNIPPELGSLARLQGLYLDANLLSGTIPPELGSLANLQVLYLANNQLSGTIPPELGSLASLLELYLFGNPLSGAVPHAFTALANLQAFYFSNTDLCTPGDSAFQEWLAAIPTVDGTRLLCGVTPTATPTATPTTTPSATPTATPTATPPAPSSITLAAVFPNQGYGDTANTLMLHGTGFAPGMTAEIGGLPLQSVQVVDAGRARAVLPAGLAPGAHAAVVRNPGTGAVDTLAGAYLVLAAERPKLYLPALLLGTSPD